MKRHEKEKWKETKSGVELRHGPNPRLNSQHLIPKSGKSYAEVVLFGDVHYGSPQCDRERVKRMIDYCFKNNVYVLIMGDLLEFATRGSVGEAVYEQVMNPQEQYKTMVDMLKPLGEKKLLLGFIRGNHELRGYKESGINIAEIMASDLNTSYLGDACWNLWYVGKQSYTLYTLHGTSSSQYIHTKLNVVIKIAQNFDAEIVACGHMHELSDASMLSQHVNKTSKTIEELKKFVLVTGHYLKYDSGYAQRKGMTIGKLGSPKIKFFSDKHDIHISL